MTAISPKTTGRTASASFRDNKYSQLSSMPYIAASSIPIRLVESGATSFTNDNKTDFNRTNFNLPNNNQYSKHLTYLDVLLGVLEVFKEGVISPSDTGLLVGTGVRVPIGLSRLTTEKSVEVGSLLVWSTLLNSVALRALDLEDLGSLLGVSVLLAHFNVLNNNNQSWWNMWVTIGEWMPMTFRGWMKVDDDWFSLALSLPWFPTNSRGAWGCTGKANSTVGRHHDNEPRNVNDAVPFEENQSASLVVVGNKQGRRYITGTLGKKVNIMAKIIRMNDISNKEWLILATYCVSG